ncbi:uncharacterized protein LOC114518028 isoform X2 [Dendronephthya gigantea]|uniref:uncharacterized protein LOC114518028 isoform X2 n=1 Tax=Dendronephthya gigantea TaxID=151771 RepID=UPI00106CDA6F|nr:uncharacterized protein LOC114518028 isoform X2 [Dendronephthya gigantea]
MDVVFLFRVLLYCASLHFSLTTRFLPSIIWDNVNPLLCCPYNWLVVPRVDIYDILGFVCPTSKLIVKQVNDQTRLGETMNFNIFRREWPGNVTNLQQAIRNGSIHSFCNVSHTDSVKLTSCEEGKYRSLPVKFTHYVFDASKTKSKKYETNKTYVFYSNGNGLKSSLNSKEVKCSMLYAVHIVSREKRVFDVTYGKEVVPSKCECNPAIKPTLGLTTKKAKTQSHPNPTKKPTPGPKETKLTPPCTTTKTTETNQNSNQQTKDRWLSVPIFIAIVIAVFTLGILCAVIYFKVLKRKPRRDLYEINNKAYSKQGNDMQNGVSEQFI